VALPTPARPRMIGAAPTPPDQPDPLSGAELDRRAAEPARPKYAVAAILVQVDADGPVHDSLTALATRLADDVREYLQANSTQASVSAAVAVSESARIAAVLPRQPGPGRAVEPVDEPDVPDVPDVIVVDRVRRYASVAGRNLDLTYREFELLAFLVEHPGQVFGRDQLLRAVWDHARVGSRTVDVHVRRLRVKLGTEAHRLTTVRNVGYRLEPRAGTALRRDLDPVA
jgi:hypothetical protein